MEKTTTLNIRVSPEVKKSAEMVLSQLGVPMATAIDMFIKQITLTGGIPFAVALPKATNTTCSPTETCLDGVMTDAVENRTP